MVQMLKVTIREKRGNYFEKVDEVKGSAELCAARIIEKYGRGIKILDMPVQEFLENQSGKGSLLNVDVEMPVGQFLKLDMEDLRKFRR